jgi:hypothetical protein
MQRSFYNFATQAEKAEQLRQERQRREAPLAPTTYHQLAGLNAELESGGRYTKPDYVTGSELASRYPAAASPWSGPQVPMEPPLGEALGPAPVVGEPHEVTRSIEALEALADNCSGSAREATSSTAPARSSSPSARLPGDVATLDRLAELMHSGIVRPVVKRRRL